MSTQAISPAVMRTGQFAASSSAAAPARNPLQQQQQQQQRRDTDRRVLHLNNRACVLVLSNGEYSEAIKLFDTALMIHKEQTEEGSIANMECSTQSPAPTYPQHDGCDIQATTINNTNSNTNGIDYSCHSCSSRIYDDDEELDEDDDEDFSEEEDEEDASETGEYDDDDDFGEMDWDEKEEDDSSSSVDEDEDDDIYGASVPMTPIGIPQHQLQHQQRQEPQCSTLSNVRSAKIPRMTTASRLRSLNYCGQQEYHAEHGLVDRHHYHHQVYGLPIVMEESEWDTAPIQDKTFVLIFNTALCNHLWGMQLMQRYVAATTTSVSASGEAIAALAEHCRETLTIAKLLYKLALENSVSFANGVDKMCYVALYNNLSHVLKTLEGYDSAEARWCDDMLLKAIFWWRDSTNHNGHSSSNNSSSSSPGTSGSSGAPSNNNTSSSNTLSDLYLDDDAEIIDAFLENVYYRVGVSENIVPAAAA